MPIYEYQCQKCNQVFEKLIRNQSQTNHISCDACGSKRAIKLVSAFAFSGTEKVSDNGSTDSSCTSCSHHQCSTCR